MSSSKQLIPHEITHYDPIRDKTEVILIEMSRFQEPMNKMLLEFLANRYGCEYYYVIDVTGNGKLDGYILSGVEVPQSLHIYSIAVREEIEGKGWAKSLLTYLITQAKSDGLKKITLEVRKNNIKARKLYENLGWSIIGEELNYYNDGVTAIKMQIDL